MGKETASGRIVRYLHELKDALESAGVGAKLAHPEAELPYLQAANPNTAQLHEIIRCDHHAPDGDAIWFFWSWGEPICPANDIHQAAKGIARVIGDRDQ